MRVFVALPCPEELLPAARGYQDLVSGIAGARLIDPAGLHLTVIPPWEEKDPAAVLRDFSAIDAGPAALTFDVAEASTTPHGEHLFWMRATEESAALRHLWLQAWRALWSQDPPRPPFPHVTLARFDDGLPDLSLPTLDPIVATLDRIALYESLSGLRYRILGERRLGL